MNEVEKMEIDLLMINDFNIFSLVIKLMEQAERFITYNGEQKKTYVKQLVKMLLVEKWGLEYYQKYEFIVPIVIEFIITISRNEILININKIKKDCKCFIF